jgi:DNA repair exonuclease SbcCD nuclease subunit
MHLIPQSFKKLAMFSDIHFGRRSNSKIHNQDCLDFVEWFANHVERDGSYSHIAFLGDWFESRSAINIETLEYSYQALQRLNSIGLPVIFIVGNHDLHRRTTRDVHSVRMFQELENFTVIDSPRVIDGILFSPFLFNHEYASIIQHNDCWAFCGHFEFKNFVVTGSSVVLEHGPDHKLFPGPKRIFSGHFHKRQTIDNVCYLGNVFPMDYGDAGDYDRGMCTYHVLEDKVEFKNWEDCPKYYKTTLSKIMTDQWEPKPKMKVKCLIDQELGYQDAQDLRESMIAAYDLRDFVLEEDRAAKQGILEGETANDEPLAGFTSVDDLVVKYLETIKADKNVKIDADLLIEIYKSVQVEATEAEE